MTDTHIQLRDQSFTGDVDVDGKQFISCKLKDVRLHYAGGTLPTFENCEVEGLVWVFRDAALRTIQLLQAQNYEGAAQEMIDAMFKPGTIYVE